MQAPREQGPDFHCSLLNPQTRAQLLAKSKQSIYILNERSSKNEKCKGIFHKKYRIEKLLNMKDLIWGKYDIKQAITGNF